MDYQIFQTVNVPTNQQDDVTSGRVEIDGREVSLIAQSDTECTFGVAKRGGDIVWIDHWLRQPTDRLHQLAARYAARGVADSYVGGYAFEIPTRRRAFLAALRRLPNHEQ